MATIHVSIVTNAMTTTVFDHTLTGCPDTTDGHHLVQWVAVPAQVWNPGSRDESTAYGDHLRGMCEWCDEHFTKEV